MTSGRPVRLLFVFALPLILSNLLQQLYNLVDSMIVGNWLGSNALAAVGSVGAVTSVVIHLAGGLSLGASIVIAQYFGAGRNERIRTCMTTICIFSVVMGAVMTLVPLLLTDPILRLINTPAETFRYSRDYLTIYLWGCVPIFLYNACNAVYIALGDSRTPLYFLILAFFMNVAGDLLFIVALGMGVAGGALATTLSQTVCTALSFAVLERKMRRIGMAKGDRLFDWREFRTMMRIAVPAALQQCVVSFGNVAVQSVMNTFGPSVVAGVSSAARTVMLMITVPLNWGNGFSNYVSQNIGAGKPERVREGMRSSVAVTAAVCAVMGLAAVFAAPALMRLFCPEDAAAAAAGARYLRIMGYSFVIGGVYMVIRAVFKGTGDMGWFVFVTMLSLGIRIVGTFTLPGVLGQDVFAVSFAAGWVAALIVTYLHYRSGKWEQHRVIQD